MTYIALLKGINVGGNKLIKMTELKSMFENLGFKNVRTLIQSGNVIFESSKSTDEQLRKRIEAGISKTFGFSASVVIRSHEELEKIIKDFPFSKIIDIEQYKINVSFLDSVPEKGAAKELEALSNSEEMFRVIGSNVYQICKMSFSDSLAAKNIVEKKLKVTATTRNWNTTNKLLEISDHK